MKLIGGIAGGRFSLLPPRQAFRSPETQSAFTTIELLTVVVVLVIIMALALPLVNRAMESGKSAKCVSNLRQLGAALMVYQADNQHLIRGDNYAFAYLPETFTWISALTNYCNLNEVRSCPSARNPGGAEFGNSGGNKWGGRSHAWALQPGSWMLPTGDPGYSSYGLNMWVRKGLHDEAAEIYRASFGTTRVDDASRIPMIMDARWEGFWPLSEDAIPPAGSLRNGQKEIPISDANWRMAENVAMLRHGNGINICFLDGSVRPVDVNDLWTFKWNKFYEDRGRVNLR